MSLQPLLSVPESVQQAATVIAGLDRCFLVGFGRLGPEQHAALQTLERVCTGTPLDEPVRNAVAAIGRSEFVDRHFNLDSQKRKPILVDAVAAECRKHIEAKCLERGWTILELAIQPDHVQLFVRAWPTDAAAEIVKECKGLPSFHLRKQFKHLLRLPSLWTRSYLASTAGNVSAETIRRYIEAQKGI